MASCYNISVNDQDWITTKEAAARSGYHVNYIRQLIRKDAIIGRKFGTIWQVHRKSFEDYLKVAEASTDRRRGPHYRT